MRGKKRRNGTAKSAAVVDDEDGSHLFGDLDELNSLNVNFAIERAKKAPRKKIPGE